MSRGYGKRIRKLQDNNNKPRKVEWQLQGKYVCNYCEGPFNTEKFTIDEVNGGFCMPECVAGYNWYILVDGRNEYHNELEEFCGRKINKPPAYHLMKACNGHNGFTQSDIYNCRYNNLSEADTKIAKKEIGDS